MFTPKIPGASSLPPKQGSLNQVSANVTASSLSDGGTLENARAKNAVSLENHSNGSPLTSNSRSSYCAGNDEHTTAQPEGVVAETQEQDNDDPVVRTIQVFVNRISGCSTVQDKSASAPAPKSDSEADVSSANVYLLQYPLRPVYRPYGDHGRLVSIKHRKHQQTLRLEYALNTDSPYFDRSQIPESSLNDDGVPENTNVNGVTHQVLASVPCVTPDSSYGVGLLRGNRLYIMPVTSVLQFRPDFSYVDDDRTTGRRPLDLQSTDAHSLDSSKTSSNTESQLSRAAYEASVATKTSNENRTDAAAQRSRERLVKTASSDNLQKNSAQPPAAASMAVASATGPGLRQQGYIPPESEWPRYPPSRIRDLLLAEPWEAVDAFYHPDSPESHELIQLLSSFKVPIASQATKSGAHQGLEEAHSPDASSVSDDPALRMVANVMNVVLKTVAAADANADSSSSGGMDGEDLRYQRVSGGPRVPRLCFSNDFKAYLDRLCNVKNALSHNANVQASGPLSYLQLSRLPCDQQVLRILQHRHVESTSAIKQLLTQQIPDEELIGHLRNYGDLILGNWVCKSHLVYEGLVAHFRDLLLFLFSSGRVIVRDSVKPYMGTMSGEMLTTLLKQLGEYRDNGWHFKLPVDKLMLEKYPQLAKQSAEKFSKDAMKATVAKIQAITAARQQPAKPDVSPQNPTNSSGTAIGLLDPELLNRAISEALRTGGAQTVTTLLPSVRHILLNQSVDSLQPTAQRLYAAGASALTEEELMTVLPRLAEAVGCDYWALRKLGNSQFDRHREVLLSIVKRHTLYPDSEEAKKGVSRATLLQEFETKKVKWDLPDFTFRQLVKYV